MDDLIDVITPASEEANSNGTATLKANVRSNRSRSGHRTTDHTTQPLKQAPERVRGSTRRRRGDGSNVDVDGSEQLTKNMRRRTRHRSRHRRRKSRMNRNNLPPKLFDYFAVVGVKQVKFEKPTEPISHTIKPTGNKNK